MTVTLEQVPIISIDDIEIAAIDFTNLLDGDEVIDSATVVEETTNDLTLTDAQVNIEVLEILNQEVAIGKAVLYELSGQEDPQYSVIVTIETDKGRTLNRRARFKVV